jgi:hypothetical protein
MQQLKFPDTLLSEFALNRSELSDCVVLGA